MLNDPGDIERDIEKIKAVKKEDIMMVYKKYIKDKPRIVTSFVPKGATDIIAENSEPADIKEENINEVCQVKIAEEGKEEIRKTPLCES